MSNIPDKIYVTEFKAGLSQIWSGIKATETSAIMQHEYIRKDTLLEWANNWEKIGVSDDFAYAIQTLIKHIESL